MIARPRAVMIVRVRMAGPRAAMAKPPAVMVRLRAVRVRVHPVRTAASRAVMAGLRASPVAASLMVAVSAAGANTSRPLPN